MTQKPLFDNDRVGENFRLDTYLSARIKCIEITEKIIAKITLNLDEKDIKKIIEDEFEKVGVTKFWHLTRIRIGSDTTKDFAEPSNPKLKTCKGEICFIDLGPIIDGHEADYGRTFLIESKQKSPLIEACHHTFSETYKIWKQLGLTGVELFNFAKKSAQNQGYDLNPLMAGHRLGDFPHKLFSSDQLFELSRKPTDHLWILEIHLLDKKNNCGAFFEDLLLENQHEVL